MSESYSIERYELAFSPLSGRVLLHRRAKRQPGQDKGIIRSLEHRDVHEEVLTVVVKLLQHEGEGFELGGEKVKTGELEVTNGKERYRLMLVPIDDQGRAKARRVGS